MGSYLRQSFGDKYYALGLTFSDGAFQSINMDKDDPNKGLIEFKIAAPQENFADWYFALPAIKNYFVDFRNTKKSAPVAEWLNGQYPMRSIGSGFSSKWEWWQYTEPTVLKKRFDGMVFIQTTTRAHPMPK